MLKPILPGGSQNLERWDQGEQVTRLADLKVGDILLELSYQFRAQNLVRITRLDDLKGREPGTIVYGMFVDPDDTSRRRMGGDHEFAIWDFELRGPQRHYFRAVPSPYQMNLTGRMIVRLMRVNKVKMRDIKAKHGITLKRIREVREKGVRGFSAAEWVLIITGKWPDDAGSQVTP